ncbi:MAG: restriction endonuclease subunit S [Victivallales bacterium]
MSWELKRLDELGYVSRGRSRHRPRDAAHLYGGPYPFIQTSDVKHANLYVNNYSQTYSEEGLAQSRLWKAGTLCITIAANIADTAVLDIDACFPDSIIGFIPDDNKADAIFIKYLFDAMLKRQYKQFTQGVAQDNLSQEKLLSLKFPVPNVTEQRRIASILSSYDDLIENNLRRIKLLEELARMLYKEWFVNFRFPGHEQIKIKEGIPEGWKRKKLKDITSFLKRGITPCYDDDAQGLVINQKCIRNGWMDLSFARRQSRKVNPERQVESGDVLVNSTGEGTLGRIAQVKTPIENCTVDTHITIVRPKPGTPLHYFGIAVMTWEARFSTMGRGATNQTELSAATIGESEITIPSRSLLLEFNLFVTPIFEQVANLHAQNNKAKAARDLLLPNLMNGGFEV